MGPVYNDPAQASLSWMARLKSPTKIRDPIFNKLQDSNLSKKYILEEYGAYVLRILNLSF